MPTEHFMRLKVDRKNSIIRALTRQFATREYADISVKELADEADISRGSFYLYFDDKEDAYLTSVKNYTDRLEQDLLNIYMKSKDIPEIIMQIFDYLTHLSHFEHSFFEKISNNLSLGIPDIIAETFDQFGEKINTLVKARIVQNNIDLTPEIEEQIDLRREILFSILISALIDMGLNRATLPEARSSLRKKVDLILSIPVNLAEDNPKESIVENNTL